LPLIYGEGRINADFRLREEIDKRSDLKFEKGTSTTAMTVMPGCPDH
jgi:hypothetical protein